MVLLARRAAPGGRYPAWPSSRSWSRWAAWPCSPACGAGAGGGTAAGDLLVAGGALSASLYTIVAKRFEDGSDALSLTAWQFTVAALVSLLVTAVRWTAGPGTGTGPAAPRFWLVAVLVGAGGFGLSFLLFNMVIGQVGAGRAAVLLNLIPVFGVASAVVLPR